MELKQVFEKIDFAKRYREICDSHQNFANRMIGNKKELYDPVIDKFDYNFKYYSKGSFYQITDKSGVFSFVLNLVLKDGQVESLIYIKANDKPLEPQGRLDFLPEDMNIPFERKRFNLPIYVNEAELEIILKEIFSIYEDIKQEVLVRDGKVN